MFLHRKWAIFILLACRPVVCLFGQGNNYLVHFDSYTIVNGLSSNHVHNCFQDSRGIMWLVREGGIDRFDGEEFKPFNHPELRNIGNMKILMEDEEHDLWIRKFDKTFVYLNIFTEKIRNSAEKFGPTFPQRVNWAVKGIDGSYLLQDEGSNILRYYPGQKPTVYYSTPGKIVSPLIEYDNGTAWSECNFNHQGGEMIATDRNGKEIIKIPYFWDHIYAKGVWGHDTIHYVTRDSFFLADFSGIVLKKPLSSLFLNYEFSDPYHNGRFPQIVVEQDRGFVWVYYPYQILLFDKSLRFLYAFDSKKYFVETSNVYDILPDNQNHTWLCTFDGLHKIVFKPNPFRPFLTEDPASTDYNPKSIRKICKAADGNIYVIASSQLFRIRPDNRTELVLKMPDLGPMDADEAGNLWFNNDRLYRYNVFTGRLATFSKLDFGNWLVKRIDQKLWFGYPLKFLYLSKAPSYEEHSFAPFVEHDRIDIYDMVRRGDNEYYFATEAGFFVLDPQKGITARYWEKGAGVYQWPCTNIHGIHVDKSGDFWLATTEGLLYWRPATNAFRLFNAKDGIHSGCHSVLEDDYGFLWISSDFGLIQFEKSSQRTRTYLVSDGLPSDEFNRLSYFKDEQSGEMYLGGLNGLVRFHPRDFVSNIGGIDTNFNLVLTECLLFSGKTNQEENIRSEVLRLNQITIQPGDLFLRIKFALTDYTRPSAITYSYRIDGYNKNWHTGKENELLLSGLPYGHFTLRVKALTPNGLASVREMTLPIYVRPPFYLQTWFLVLAALGVILGVAGYIRRRTKLLTERTTVLEGMVSERTKVIENQRKSLKELYDFKTRLYANITHEFRTPLTLIIGPARKALQSTAAATQPDIRQNLDNILQNSEQLLGLVNQMLDLNKLEAKAMTPEYYQADIMAFLYQIVERFQHYAASHGIRLAFQPETERLVMDFDAEMVEKILNNLLSNALKFTPAQGEIHVGAGVREERLQVSVKDTGRGIEAAQLPFIFDRFYQSDNSATRHSEGTGIGLALVKELVELLEGSIRVDSIPGKETTFVLELPVRMRAPVQANPAPLSPKLPAHLLPAVALPDAFNGTAEGGDKPNVVVIEDNPAVAHFIADCLRPDYAVSTIHHSVAGLEAVRERLPDLVICDLMMPEMDGYEVCTRIKNDEHTSHIPVVFLSAVTEQAERLKRLHAGADAYISKPFREEELKTVTAGLLESRRRLRSKYLAHFAGTAPSDGVAEGTEVLPPMELDFLKRVKTIILDNLAKEDFDGPALARSLGFSNSQLHRKLSALTGLPAGRYIHQIRLAEARELLSRKDLTIAEIAYQTGFSDPAYFTRLFTKTFGRPPRAFRADN